MERYSDKAIDIINDLHTERLNYESEYIPLIDCANQCAAYEDTGLTPEKAASMKMDMAIINAMFQYSDVERMQELAKADKEGRVVVLPAKTVYELTLDAGPKCDLNCPKEICFGENSCERCKKSKLYIYERHCTQGLAANIGKTVFLTREEAEEALRRQNNG